MFHSNRDGNFEIYTMNPDGSGPTRLTNNGADDVTPTWSADGTKIAWVSTRDGQYEIYTMNADGTGQTRVTNNAAADVGPSWSPDGKIWFTTNRDGPASNYEIYRMNADGTSPVRVTNNPANDGWPRVSPDGTKVAFASNRDGNFEIYLMNPDGTGQTNLTNNANADMRPNWTPDGAFITFDSDRQGDFGNGVSEIWVIRPDGSSLAHYDQPISSQGTDFAAVTSPSDTKIAWQRGVEIYSYTFGSSTANALTTTSANEYPDWQPLVKNHVRPRGATPLFVPLVPAYKTCTNPNARHHAPISQGACNPAKLESSYLTVGTPDANGQGANFVGSVRIALRATAPQDGVITVSMTDVRCAGTSGGCSSGALADYVGNLLFEASFRITDKGSGGAGGATVVDIPLRFPVGAPCQSTTSGTVGSTCSINTTLSAQLGPSTIVAGERAIWQLKGEMSLYDGGPDGVATTTSGNTLFAQGGLFFP